MHPELAPNFVTSPYDDLSGGLETLGINVTAGPRLGSVFHGLQTLPGMLSVIVAAVAGAIGGLAALAISDAFNFALPLVAALAGGAVAFMVAVVLLGNWGRRSFKGFGPSLEPRFPTPKR